MLGESVMTEEIHAATTQPIVHSVMEGINGELVALPREGRKEVGGRKRKTELVCIQD